MLTLADAKDHLRVETNDEDALIERLIRAATEYVEARVGQHLGEPTAVVEWPRTYGDRSLWLRNVPQDGTVTVTSEGDTVDPETYEIRGRRLVRLDGSAWWRDSNYAVEYTAGFPTGEAPYRFQQAALLLVGHWFRNREQVITGTISGEVQKGVEALVPKRVRI